MIFGLGTDLVEIQRFSAQKNLEKPNETAHPHEPKPSKSLLARVLTEAEREVYEARSARSVSRGVSFLATRFAAKEALAKAMGCGIGKEFSFQDASLLNLKSGQPYFELSPKLQNWIDERQLRIQVSVSDEQHFAGATVILFEG